MMTVMECEGGRRGEEEKRREKKRRKGGRGSERGRRDRKEYINSCILEKMVRCSEETREEKEGQSITRHTKGTECSRKCHTQGCLSQKKSTKHISQAQQRASFNHITASRLSILFPDLRPPLFTPTPGPNSPLSLPLFLTKPTTSNGSTVLTTHPRPSSHPGPFTSVTPSFAKKTASSLGSHRAGCHMLYMTTFSSRTAASKM